MKARGSLIHHVHEDEENITEAQEATAEAHFYRPFPRGHEYEAEESSDSRLRMPLSTTIPTPSGQLIRSAPHIRHKVIKLFRPRRTGADSKVIDEHIFNSRGTQKSEDKASISLATKLKFGIPRRPPRRHDHQALKNTVRRFHSSSREATFRGSTTQDAVPASHARRCRPLRRDRHPRCSRSPQELDRSKQPISIVCSGFSEPASPTRSGHSHARESPVARSRRPRGRRIFPADRQPPSTSLPSEHSRRSRISSHQPTKAASSSIRSSKFPDQHHHPRHQFTSSIDSSSPAPRLIADEPPRSPSKAGQDQQDQVLLRFSAEDKSASGLDVPEEQPREKVVELIPSITASVSNAPPFANLKSVSSYFRRKRPRRNQSSRSNTEVDRSRSRGNYRISAE